MKYTENIQSVLVAFGFDSNEIRVYEILLEYGRLNARRIASLSKVPRVTTYQTLERLAAKGLVRKGKDAKIDMFEAVSPTVLNNLIGAKVQAVESQRFSFEKMLPELMSRYGKGMKRPSVTFREGIEGFRKIYEDILDGGRDLYIIASAKKVPEYQKIIEENKVKQQKAGIKHFALVSRSNDSHAAAQSNSKLKSGGSLTNLKKVKLVLDDDLSLDGQILMYGEKVVITHFSGEVSHVIIENKHIAHMFKQLFSFMWQGYNKKIL